MIGRIKLKGGKKVGINGIIKQYKIQAGNNISSGDFVEFVNGTNMTTGTDTELSRVKTSYNTSAVKLNKNKVFITYYDDTNSCVSGIVCTISGTTITTGSETQLSADASYYVSSTRLTENKVFVAHGLTRPFGIVCTISGTTITTGSETQLSTKSSSADNVLVTSLNENKVFVTHRTGGTSTGKDYTSGIVCTISGTTITTGTETTVASVSQYTYQYSSIVTLNENKVFITYRFGDYLAGKVCTVSGTTISSGTYITISTNNSQDYLSNSATLLSEDKVLVTYKNSIYLHGRICTISGTTFTMGTATQLNRSANSTIRSTLLSDDKVLIIYNKSNVLQALLCTVSGTSIAPDNDISLNIYNELNRFVVTIDDGKALITHDSDNTNHYLNGIVCELEKLVSSFSQKINGVAKEDGTSGMTIDVTVPNV